MPTHKSSSRGYKNSSSLRSRGGAEENEVLRHRLEKVEAVGRSISLFVLHVYIF